MSCSSRGESGCSQSVLPSRTGTENSTKTQPMAWDRGQGTGYRGQGGGAGPQQLLTTLLEAGTVCPHCQCSGDCGFCEQLGHSRMSLSQDQPPRQTGSEWSLQRKVPKGSVPVVGEL